MNNRKGFTLVELIAVVVIIGILALIAIPNVLNMVERGKKEQFVTDAREFLSKAKYCYKIDNCRESNFSPLSGGCRTISLSELNYAEYSNADGVEYDYEGSKVRVCIINNNEVYEVLTKTKVGGRGISADDPKDATWEIAVKESELDIKFVH